MLYGVAAGAGGEDHLGRLAADQFGIDNFIGLFVFEHPILVNTGGVGKGIDTDYRFVNRNRDAGQFADQAAGTVNFLQV